MDHSEPWITEAETCLPYLRFELRKNEWPAHFRAVRHSESPILTLTTSRTRAVYGAGTVRFETEGSVSPPAHFGGVSLRPQGIPIHVDGGQSGGNGRTLLCTFDAQYFVTKSGLDDWDRKRLEMCRDIRSGPIATTMKRVQTELVRPDFASASIIEGLAQTLAFELARFFAVDRNRTRSASGLAPWQLRRVDDALRDYRTKLPSQSELASLCGVSPRYLASAFRHTAGKSLNDHIKTIRVSLAKEMLAEPNCRVTQVAMDLGFPSLTSFSLAFSRAVGVSPSKFGRMSRSRTRLQIL